MILNGFFNDHSFWEVLLKPLIVQSHCCSVEDLLLAIAKAVLSWVEFPFVVPSFLLTWRVVTVSPLVHLMHLRIIANESTSHGIYHFFSTFKATCGYTKGYGSFGSLIWPLVASSVALTQWLALV